jgi:dTMP kinase
MSDSMCTSRSYDGLLIIVEGGDGLGKSTQVNILANHLSEIGLPVDRFDFPNKSGTPVGSLIGNFLKGDYGDVTPEFLGLAFASDRLAVRDSILENLQQGRVVICDRYVGSNISFQGAKISNLERREKLDTLLRWVEYDLFKLPKPDLEIVLTASDSYYHNGAHLVRSISNDRAYIDNRADIHESSVGLQNAVNNYFLGLAESNKLKKIRIEDAKHCRLTVKELANKIWHVVDNKLIEEFYV